MSVEFLVFARFYGADRQVYLKDVRRGFPSLEGMVEAEKELREAGARTSRVLFSRDDNIIYIRGGFQ
jgi:hypothetical protein